MWPTVQRVFAILYGKNVSRKRHKEKDAFDYTFVFFVLLAGKCIIKKEIQL
jgi:hypothetical protein